MHAHINDDNVSQYSGSGATCITAMGLWGKEVHILEGLHHAIVTCSTRHICNFDDGGLY